MLSKKDRIRWRAEEGLAQAIDRTKTAIASGVGVTLPFTESIEWIYKLWIWHKDKAGEKNLIDLCTGVPEGETFLAVKWARGRALHSEGELGGLTSGFTGIVVGGVFALGTNRTGYAWADIKFINMQRHPNDDEKAMAVLYTRHVANREMVSVLEVARDFAFGLHPPRPVGAGPVSPSR